MSEGPTIGDWTQHEWVPDDASSFPARVRLRNTAWMVYYEPEVTGLKEELLSLHKENAKLRKLVQDMLDYGEGAGTGMFDCFYDRIRELWRDREEDDD